MNVAESNKPIAENILKIIDEKALSRPEIARRAGMTPRQLTDIVNGIKLVRACEIKPLAEAMGVEVNRLFGEMSDENSEI